MSIEFDQKLVAFDRWYQQNRHCERDMGKDIKFLQDAIDKSITLIECANKDLKAYERRDKTGLLIY